MYLRLLDFMSHAHMHLPFNSGFLQTLRAAYPQATISFHAGTAHVQELNKLLPATLSLHKAGLSPYSLPAGKSRHSPRASNMAAQMCFAQVAALERRNPADLTILLGGEAGILRFFRRHFSKLSQKPLVYILHNYLGAAIGWRSRNPYVRHYDFISEFKRPLPAGQYWACLESYISDVARHLAPKNDGQIITLPHPILPEHIPKADPSVTRPLKIGFLGFCSRAKGFHRFVKIANRLAGPMVEFHAIGTASPDYDHINIDSLSRKPHKNSLNRANYLQALGDMDYILLPLSRAYDYTASGTLMDAVAAAKPVLLPQDGRPSLLAKFAGAHAPIGPDIADDDAVIRFLQHGAGEAAYAHWQDNLCALCAARHPTHICGNYKSALDAIMAPDEGLQGNKNLAE